MLECLKIIQLHRRWKLNEIDVCLVFRENECVFTAMADMRLFYGRVNGNSKKTRRSQRTFWNFAENTLKCPVRTRTHNENMTRCFFSSEKENRAATRKWRFSGFMFIGTSSSLFRCVQLDCTFVTLGPTPVVPRNSSQSKVRYVWLY
jgi:hypothetical protein